MWGQCDSIYAAFAIGAVYFGLTKQSKSAYAFMALALSFKLQAVFLLPILPMFVIANKIKLKDCYMFFAVYLATLLPAILAGMPLNDALFGYVTQANYYNRLNLNIINIWLFVGNVDYDSFRTAGIYMTGVAVLGLMYFTYINRARLVNTVDFVRLAYLFAIIMPFMLPKMHDRYYFMADILAVTLFFYDKRRWYVPAVTVLCSFLAYTYFLMFGHETIDFRYAAIALFVVIMIVLRDYIISLRCDKKQVTE
jgi:Gpi18-like mannosyltransferase